MILAEQCKQMIKSEQDRKKIRPLLAAVVLLKLWLAFFCSLGPHALVNLGIKCLFTVHLLLRLWSFFPKNFVSIGAIYARVFGFTSRAMIPFCFEPGSNQDHPFGQLSIHHLHHAKQIPFPLLGFSEIRLISSYSKNAFSNNLWASSLKVIKMILLRTCHKRRKSGKSVKSMLNYWTSKYWWFF